MDLPPTSANERRAVPRHMRDGEHVPWDEAAAAEGGQAPRRRPALGLLLDALAILAGLWAWLGRA